MNKSKKLMKLLEDYDSDVNSWFDDLADTDIPELRALAQDIASGKLKPTSEGFNTFKNVIQQVLRSSGEQPALETLQGMISAIDGGKYKSEFKLKFGDTSQVSNLFSDFRQSVLYSKEVKKDESKKNY
jgi:hypothetical protein